MGRLHAFARTILWGIAATLAVYDVAAAIHQVL